MKKEGFNEFGEPVLEQIDDYKKIPKEKKRVIFWVIVSGLIMGLFYGAARYYFWDLGEKELNIPSQQKIRNF